MLLSDLEHLEDIASTLVFEEEPSLFTEEHSVELVETALHLMDECLVQYPHIISEPDFKNILLEEIKDIFYIQMEEHIDDINIGDNFEEDMNILIEEAFNIFITIFHPDKSLEYIIEHVTSTDEENIITEQKIQRLREIIQPVQRTPEWYQFRWNLITASNAWKAFESQSTINQLIYEKCQPIKVLTGDEEIKPVNINSPLHWGQKYEPLSVMIYEAKYGTKVEEFGCIQHHKYKFLGASPDGIVINKESERYGRMLEIKNVVSREINGIPKKEYWTQMQLQMEVCDLDECDFLETKFTEYSDRISYNSDIPPDNNLDKTISFTGKPKGIIIYFQKKDGTPFYAYKPLNIILSQDITNWEEETVTLYQSEIYGYIFVKFIYWKLDVFSCVLIFRKKEWFENNIEKIGKVWETIETERITGYEHRGPNKKPKKEYINNYIEKPSQGCLLKFNKIVKLDNNEINDTNEIKDIKDINENKDIKDIKLI
jgi:putative phage-type endonuclease